MSRLHPDPETEDQRHARHLRMLRELAEFGMILATDAVTQARTQTAAPSEPGVKTPDPHLAFARVATVVRHAIALEARIAAGFSPTRAPRETPRETLKSRQPARDPARANDPRQAPLRQALHKLATAEPDRTTRTELRRLVDECIDETLSSAPAEHLSLGDAFTSICTELGFRPDPAKLPDELLPGPPIRRTLYPPPGSKIPDG